MVIDEGLRGRVDALKALAEPVRWEIVQRLAVEDLCVCHLVEELGLAQPLVSHHLKVLRQAGLVEADRYRQWVYYRLRGDAIGGLVGELTSLVAAPREDGRRRPCC